MEKYSKLGYGSRNDIKTAIDSGILDAKDLVVTNDTSELIYIKNDKTLQEIQMRKRLFDSKEEAILLLNSSSGTYAGQDIGIKDESGKYQSYTVQASESGFIIEPTVTTSATGFVWQEF